MDIKTGKIYPDFDTAKAKLQKDGVPEREIEDRLIQGTKHTLRKLRKMIRAQEKREREKGLDIFPDFGQHAARSGKAIKKEEG